jgi:hypothetical protein
MYINSNNHIKARRIPPLKMLIFCVSVVLGSEIRTLSLLGGYSTIWATPQPFYVWLILVASSQASLDCDSIYASHVAQTSRACPPQPASSWDWDSLTSYSGQSRVIILQHLCPTFVEMGSCCLSRLALNHDYPSLHLSNSWNNRFEPQWLD